MEIDIEQELQILKSEYNTLKKELKNRILWTKSFSNLSESSLHWLSARKSKAECGSIYWLYLRLWLSVWIRIFRYCSEYWYRYGHWPTWESACGSAGNWEWTICWMTMYGRWRKNCRLSQVLWLGAHRKHYSSDRDAYLYLYASVCPCRKPRCRSAHHRIGYCFHHSRHCKHAVSV